MIFSYIFLAFYLTYIHTFIPQVFWHSISQSIWQPIWHSIWHIFWHFIWRIFRILSGKYSGILSSMLCSWRLEFPHVIFRGILHNFQRITFSHSFGTICEHHLFAKSFVQPCVEALFLDSLWEKDPSKFSVQVSYHMSPRTISDFFIASISQSPLGNS